MAVMENVDPRRLRANFERGRKLLESAADDEGKVNGARLVNSAAILGYEPARILIAREYPRSQLIQTAVTGSEAVRYSLDPLIVSSPIAQSGRIFLVLLASYFAGRNDLASYANYLLEALGDDHRLTDEDHLKELLAELAHVPGACLAVGHAVVKARIVSGPACSSGLQLQLANYFQTTAPAGREAEIATTGTYDAAGVTGTEFTSPTSYSRQTNPTAGNIHNTEHSMGGLQRAHPKTRRLHTAASHAAKNNTDPVHLRRRIRLARESSPAARGANTCVECQLPRRPLSRSLQQWSRPPARRQSRHKRVSCRLIPKVPKLVSKG